MEGRLTWRKTSLCLSLIRIRSRKKLSKGRTRSHWPPTSLKNLLTTMITSKYVYHKWQEDEAWDNMTYRCVYGITIFIEKSRRIPVSPGLQAWICFLHHRFAFHCVDWIGISIGNADAEFGEKEARLKTPCYLLNWCEHFWHYKLKIRKNNSPIL